jgi:hypothetical protein
LKESSQLIVVKPFVFDQNAMLFKFLEKLLALIDLGAYLSPSSIKLAQQGFADGDPMVRIWWSKVTRRQEIPSRGQLSGLQSAGLTATNRS